METLKQYAEIFLSLTTDNYKGCGKRAAYKLTNGITMEAVKGIMKDFGLYTDCMKDMELLKAIQSDHENKYLTHRYYSNTNARMTHRTEHYVPSVKGCKEIYEYLIKK